MKSEPPLFNSQQIVNVNSISRSSPHQNGRRSNSAVRQRSLFLFGTATGSICSLTPGKFFFEEDPTTGLYYWNDEKNKEFRDNYFEYNFTGLKKWNETNITNSSNAIMARACLCTLFVDRPVEFCSADFLSCNVRTNPITCFTLSSTDTFIESFWPVLFFWALIILYSLYFTEAGKAARQYCRRKLFLCGKKMQRMWGDTIDLDNESDILVERVLDHMIENNPSRVSNIYRERIYRQRRRLRYEQRREQWCCYKASKKLRSLFSNYICCFCQTTSSVDSRRIDNTDNNVGVGNANAMEAAPEVFTLDNDNFSRLPSPSAPRLALKTKVYHEASVNPTTTVGTFAETVSPGEAAPNSADAVATSRSLSSMASFHRATANDSVGIEEIDEEVEIGIRCAICLIRLRDGIDIVGDIPCNHCMHKQCLKEWLARKNRCPLCQLPDIAERQQPGMVDVSPDSGAMRIL
jgi:Ring finger domain